VPNSVSIIQMQFGTNKESYKFEIANQVHRDTASMDTFLSLYYIIYKTNL